MDVSQLKAAQDSVVAALRWAEEDQWTESTPCPDWDVRALVDHVVFGNRVFISILSGEPGPPQEQIRATRDQDAPGGDPVAAWRDSAAGLLAAFDAPGVLEQSFRSPLGPMPGAGLAGVRLTETLVHGWDLARSTGQQPAFDEAVTRTALDFTMHQLPPGADRSSFPFAPEQPAPADAPAIDRLAAHLGRRIAGN